MKHCLFLILLVLAPGLAFAVNPIPITTPKQKPPQHHQPQPVKRSLHMADEPKIVMRPLGDAPRPKRRIASVTAQPMIIKLKPQKNFSQAERTVYRPTMSMRPVYPPRRVVTTVPKKRPPRREVSSYPIRPTQGAQTRMTQSKVENSKLAKTD